MHLLRTGRFAERWGTPSRRPAGRSKFKPKPAWTGNCANANRGRIHDSRRGRSSASATCCSMRAATNAAHSLSRSGPFSFTTRCSARALSTPRTALSTRSLRRARSGQDK
jgi:hypothetical protein